MATIRDVAARAGVSIATVSRVLNGRGTSTPETERRVRRAARELIYTANRTARSLKTGKTATVALLLSDYRLLENPEIVATLCRVVQAQGCMVELLLDGDLEAAVVISGGGRHDGLLLLDVPRNEAALGALVKRGQRFVLLGGESDREDINLVEIDHFGAAYTVTSELIARGHREILFVEDNADLHYTQELKRGYLFALDEQGIAYRDDLLIHNSDSTVEKEVLGRDALLARACNALASSALGREPGCTAVLTTHDRIAFGALSAARELDLEIPEDLSVIGYGNTALSAYGSPALTTVTVPFRQLAELGAEILMNSISREDSIVKRVTLQAQLVHRDTLGKGPYTHDGPTQPAQSIRS
jgi:DNA-binding LacI/PurR family transcriptional regulator